MNEATATQAAQDLASMLNSAKLEEGILNGQIPPELLSGLNGLNKEQMEKLLQALELNKSLLSMTVSNLANLKMIDPAMLAKCQKLPDNATIPARSRIICRNCTNGCIHAALAECMARQRRAGRRRAGSADDMGRRRFGKGFEVSGTRAAAVRRAFPTRNSSA